MMPLPPTNSDGVQTTAPSSFLPTQLEGLGSQLHDLQRNTLWRYAANPWKNTTSTKEDSYIHKSCQKYHCMMHCQRWNMWCILFRDVRPAPPRPAPRKKGCPAPPRRKASLAPPRENWQILRGGAAQSWFESIENLNQQRLPSLYLPWKITCYSWMMIRKGWS